MTTLGRGGSDTTAVALAAALHADVCEIYTDVDGLFSADPRIVPKAHRLRSISTEETLELAAHGAKILHLRAVEFARRYKVPLHVRSSFSEKEGTWISDRPASPALKGLVPDAAFLDPKEGQMEQPIISGIAHDRGQDKITVAGVPNHPGRAAMVFQTIAAAGANIDMIVQNIPVARSDPREHRPSPFPKPMPRLRSMRWSPQRMRLASRRCATTRISASFRWSERVCVRIPVWQRDSSLPCQKRESILI